MQRLIGRSRYHTCLRLLILSLAPASGYAACTVSTTSVLFGQYDVFATVANDATGDVTITCDTTTSYTVSLSSGSGTLSQRTLLSGSNVLEYNLFANSSRTTVWGDGSSGTSTVSATTSGVSTLTVYGLVPARQNVPPGSYSDVVIVTVTY